MYLCIYGINQIFKIENWMNIFLKIFIGILVYCMLNIKYIFSIVDINKILYKLKLKKEVS